MTATLRQRRYAAMAALMIVVAALCVLAGTWQISRFHQSVRDNRALRANTRAAAVPLTPSLVALVGQGAAPGRDEIRYRTVVIRGEYTGQTQFVRRQSDDGVSDFDVLSPVRTADGIVLVVRGSVTNHSTVTPPRNVAAPPTGPVQLRGRLQTAEPAGDGGGRQPDAQVLSVNPGQQAARSGRPTFDAYVTLLAGQAGGRGLQAIAPPDGSNPAGGAYEAQHFAYIVQWYLFALLALVAPFWIRRHEVRETREKFFGREVDTLELAALGIDDADQLPALGAGAPAATAALGAGEPGEAGASAAAQLSPTGADRSGVELALRSGAALVTAQQATQQWERAARLADRYGLSIGDAPKDGRRRVVLSAGPRRKRPEGEATVHASHDYHHGAYNDYLWQLALADGELADDDGRTGRTTPTSSSPGPADAAPVTTADDAGGTVAAARIAGPVIVEVAADSDHDSDHDDSDHDGGPGRSAGTTPGRQP